MFGRLFGSLYGIAITTSAVAVVVAETALAAFGGLTNQPEPRATKRSTKLNKKEK